MYRITYLDGTSKDFSTMKQLLDDTKLDKSSVYKFIKHKKYATLGNNMRGRPRKGISPVQKPTIKIEKKKIN